MQVLSQAWTYEGYLTYVKKKDIITVENNAKNTKNYTIFVTTCSRGEL